MHKLFSLSHGCAVGADRREHRAGQRPGGGDAMSQEHPRRSTAKPFVMMPTVPSVAADIELAAASELPVLISADPVASRAIALELGRVGHRRRTPVEIVDCREPDALATQPLRTRPGCAPVLLLQEVHALSRREQLELEQQLEEVLLLGPAGRVRVVASSSASLYDRVVDERFRDRLYYRLNMIHIVVPSPSGEDVMRGTRDSQGTS
jgi:hypothetical protein